MGEPKPRQAERNAGAFLGTDPVGMIPVPMRTLSDDYHDGPTEPEEEHEPRPEPHGLIRRLMDRLMGHADQAD